MGGVLARLSPPSFQPARDIPDQTGKVILVTGGNTGIGYETVKQLLLKNATVYLAARSPEKAAIAIAQLKAETNGKEAVFLQLDLADLPSVKKAAEAFLAQEEKLDVLINNAGVMVCPPGELTKQGYDMQFGTNVIGHYLFTTLLLPALRKAATDTVPARALQVSSAGHAFAAGRGIDFTTMKGSAERDTWIKAKGSFMGPWRLYGQSKLGNIYIANYFAKTYPDFLVSCSLHPGSIKSDLQRHMGWLRTMTDGLLYPTPFGALTQLWGATVATPGQITGQYLVPWGSVGKPDKRATDTKMEEEMIAFVKEAVKEYV
ncbi:Short-chain dehydrogenase/reductase family protein [Mycena indigotica]|uniref:Short-chain dehydrogenase/reductase family protein n=1 Tax=Mycena indigotica TaxID=2126181 RepID=A0A8H6ST46_9AGAR|nr:Short-chain dehydrogenase/reductase family protein [Mycena indigotica]KAF7303475.1 Short-chain dehydrogenase/reductase family protein [Mycena indigotica]